MSRKRRNHPATLKAKVALAALKGDKTISELAEKFEVHPHQVQQWKKQLSDEASSVFGESAEQRNNAMKEVNTLHARIGQLTMENDFLSKTLGS